MSQNIVEQCQIEVSDQVGDHDNMYFIPAVAPLVLNLCTYMPLWSGIMCKAFKYGDIPATSASIESQFNDLKNRVLKHVNMPMRIDDFLKLHIQSINGTMKLMNSKINKIPLEDTNINQSSQNAFPKNDKPINDKADNNKTDIIRINDDLSNLDDILNLKEDSNKYIYNQPTLTITEIHTIPLLETEDTSEENWGNILINLKKKKKPIYLTENREILLRNLDSKAKTNIIGLLKNGNLSEFKSIKLDGENFVLSNTCAFDSIVQILAVAYCDSNEYATFVLKKKNESTLWHLIFALHRDSVTIQTYKKRAKILKQLYPGEPMINGITLLSVEQAADSMLIKLLQNEESVEIIEKCTSCNHEKIEKKQCITVCVSEKNPTKRQIEYLLNFEINNLQQSFRCKFCSKVFDLILKFGHHIFFILINLNNSMDTQFTDTNLQLKNIPKSLTVSDTEYYFRGSVTTPDNQKQTIS